MKSNYRKFYREYKKKDHPLKPYQRLGVAFLIVVLSGFIGWLWEFIICTFDHGAVYMQGGNLFPWMNIYAFGALLIVPTTYKFRKRPWVVFLIAFFITGTVELLAGWLVYTFGDGTRYWHYTGGLLEIGNIGGFVCFASATTFGIAALLLMYLVFPVCIYLSQKMKKRTFLILTITLFSIVILDELTNLTLKNLNLPTAMDFYRSVGLEYWNY